MKPKQSAFIRLRNNTSNKVIYSVDVTHDAVQYNWNSLTFNPNLKDPMKPESFRIFFVELDEGVAIPKKGGECGSAAVTWAVGAEGK